MFLMASIEIKFRFMVRVRYRRPVLLRFGSQKAETGLRPHALLLVGVQCPA